MAHTKHRKNVLTIGINYGFKKKKKRFQGCLVRVVKCGRSVVAYGLLTKAADEELI